MRRLAVLLLAASCAETDSGGHAQALIVHVRFMAPLDETPLDRFEVVLAKPDGFPEFEPVITSGDGGDYTLTSADRLGGGGREAVLTWPERWSYEGPADMLFEFDEPSGFSLDLVAVAFDGDVPFASGSAAIEVPDGGTAEVDLYVACLLDGCETPRALGATCDDAAQCQSTFCVDGVCCESACDGTCEQCSPVDGACEAIAPAETPDGECGTDPDCKGLCDGNRACAYPDASTTCDDDVCNVCDGAGACVARPAGTAIPGECPACQWCNDEGQCTPATGMDPKGDCVGDMGCDGVCNESGACDWPLDGTVCAAPACVPDSVQTWACDERNCVSSLDPCDPFACVAAACLDTCDDDSDCVAMALCDRCPRVDMASPICESVASDVSCGAAGGGELQMAIDTGCTAGVPCFLRISGTCDNIIVTDKDVTIDGGGTATINGAGTTPIVATEAAQETRIALVGTTVTGGSGTQHGISAVSSTGLVHVCLIGSRAESNGGNGVDVDNADLFVLESTIEGNDESGIRATDSSVVVRRSTIVNNLVDGLPGVNLGESSFEIENSFVVRNGSFGVRLDAIGLPPVHVFRHNTVADNLGGGMDCVGGTGGVMVERSLFSNPAGTELIGCTSTSSDIPLIDDVCGNMEADPGFMDRSPPSLDYHLIATAGCLDSLASCDAAVPIDYDGDLRPSGPMCEVGADEVP